MSSDEGSSSSLEPLPDKKFERRNRGRMIQKMLAKAPAADEFWDEQAQQFFAEEDGDNGFDVQKDPDANYVDKVDEDFDESESEASSEHVDDEKSSRRKSTYVDPRKRVVPPAGPKKLVGVAGQPEKPVKREKRVYKKTKVETSDRVVRGSTKARTEITNEVASMVQKTRRKNRKRIVRVMTQAEILRAADKTERENIASLNAIKAWEAEERNKRKPRAPVVSGPRVIYHSSQLNTKCQTVLIWRDCDTTNLLPKVFESFDGLTNLNPPNKKIANVQIPQFEMPAPPPPIMYTEEVTSVAVAPPPVMTKTTANASHKKKKSSSASLSITKKKKSASSLAQKKNLQAAARKREREINAPNVTPSSGVSRSGRKIKRKNLDDFQEFDE